MSHLPVFPLSEYYLFPGAAAPLHIFETRYRQMMDDLMDGRGRLVVVPLATEPVLGDNGPVLPEVGTLAEVMQHEKMEDGRWMILLLALDRVAITEVPSERLYRRVRAELLPEPEIASAEGMTLDLRLIEALRERASGDWDAPLNATTGRLADVLLHSLPLELAAKDQAYRERDPIARAGLALAWHKTMSLDAEDAGAS
ncbi:MAG: LON peptidase substrate-binding domain-containing protein [Candidatus Krumholzibacteria bacterium]|nr:LON peptidase substrate-binding domain-containing protein [Candidatus Krumholzibacteria bacterium]